MVDDNFDADSLHKLKLIRATLQVEQGIVWRIETNWEIPANDDSISEFSSFEDNYDSQHQPNPRFVFLWIDLVQNIKDDPSGFIVTFFENEYYIYRKTQLVQLPTLDLIDTLNSAMIVPVALPE